MQLQINSKFWERNVNKQKKGKKRKVMKDEYTKANIIYWNWVYFILE